LELHAAGEVRKGDVGMKGDKVMIVTERRREVEASYFRNGLM
jgi:hypothetical protein